MLLSPDARYLASVSTIGRDVTRIHVGPFGGELIPFDADNVRFLNGERAVLLAERRDGMVVSELSLEGTPVIAAQRDLSDLETPTLTVDAATGGWQLFGWTSGGIALIEGDSAGGVWRERRWPIDVDDEYLMPVAVGGAGPILLETRYGQRTPAWRLELMPLLPESFDVESRSGCSASADGRKSSAPVSTPAVRYYRGSPSAVHRLRRHPDAVGSARRPAARQCTGRVTRRVLRIRHGTSRMGDWLVAPRKHRPEAGDSRSIPHRCARPHAANPAGTRRQCRRRAEQRGRSPIVRLYPLE